MRRLAVLPLLLLLPACSDDGGNGGPSLEERRADYVAQAEEVCAQANDDVEALTAPTSVAEVPEYTDSVVELLQRTVTEVRALTPPEEDQAELREKLLTPLEADVQAAKGYAAQLSAAAEAEDSATLLRLAQELPETSADLEYMREYGLVQCAEAIEQAR
ncbi:MAG TPA: hypothetical protein VNU26_06280 [Mycobacteriales bacterium]|nr:hypothetical protein [Mycobacteriales bacterium]